MARRLAYLLPLIVLGVLTVYFVLGLQRDPQRLPSALLDRPVPELDLPPIQGRSRGLKTADLKGEVSLVNIFGSWCVACRIEHPFLMELKKTNAIPIHGIDWREKDPKDGPAWLDQFGDPYTLIGDDPNSVAAIAFGVTGAPETFVVDKKGIIRYKQIGPITPEIWQREMLPLIEKLRAE